ncbi:MAG: YfiR family protein [Candidatus Riflebacteria bacterium]|nr:YfiR family protein [Candidatus Riflebacteria bacterium]
MKLKFSSQAIIFFGTQNNFMYKKLWKIAFSFEKKGIFAIIALFFFWPLNITFSQDEFSVKSAFLINFPMFVEWPSESLSSDKPFKIGIFNNQPFAETAKKILANKTIKSQPVNVESLSEIDEKCQIIYFSTSSKEPEIDPEKLKGLLTIGEGDSFLQNGGIIAFFLEDNKIRFSISNNNASKAGLKISSKLLKLAKKVF